MSYDFKLVPLLLVDNGIGIWDAKFFDEVVKFTEELQAWSNSAREWRYCCGCHCSG
jgi:hypothetical protein